MTIRLPIGTGRGRPRAAGEARRPGARRRALCGRDHACDRRPDRSQRSARSDRAAVRARHRRTRRPRREERADPIGDNAHSPVEGIVHRYPDRVLLKLVNVCAVYCRFCFRREMVGPGKQALSRTTARCRARLHRGASRDLGSDPHRRRSAGALGAPPRRGHQAHRGDRAREDRPPAYAPAGRLAREDHARAGARAQGARRRRPTWRCTPIIRAS